MSALQGRVLPAFSSGARGRTQRGLSCEPGCRSDLDSPHGQSGAVRGKPMAHPAQTPERGGAHDAQGHLLRRVVFFFCGCLWLASVVACVVVATGTA